MLTKLSRETLAEQAARNLMAFIEDQGLKPGKHRIQARATDRAGNTDGSPASKTVKILP